MGAAQAVQREHGQAGRAVDEHEVILVIHFGQRLAGGARAAQGHQLDFSAGSSRLAPRT